MKKLVKILSVGIACLLLITSFFFIPKNKLETTSADTVSNTYEYTAELDTDYYGLGDFSISDIREFYFSYGHYLKMTINVPYTWSNQFTFLSSTSYTGRTYFDYFILNGIGLNVCVVPSQKYIYFETNGTTVIDGVTYYNVQAINDYHNNFTYDIYFSNEYFSVSDDKVVSTYIGDVISSSFSGWLSVTDFTKIVDMDSATNYSFYTSTDRSSNPYLLALLKYCFGSSHPIKYFQQYNFLNSDTSLYECTIKDGSTVKSFNFRKYFNFNVFDFVDFTYNTIIYSNSFKIYQPSYRVNNTLILYNYDYYNGLNDVKCVSYVLRKNNDFYNVEYLASLPNSKFIQLYNQELNNIIFDEYIELTINYDSKFVTPTFSGSNSSAIEFINYLGYDFNFSFYVQPLVSNTSSYNYDFKKPSYKDGSIKLSIAPPKLDIPVLAWAENILIFFLFYCPVISDLIELIHFDKFFAVLLHIFDIYTSSALGDFVLGCFAFILFWNMLALIMPRFVQTSSKIYEDSQLNYNISERRKEKKLHKYNEKKKHYLHKQIDKEYKLKEKRKKKGLPD